MKKHYDDAEQPADAVHAAEEVRADEAVHPRPRRFVPADEAIVALSPSALRNSTSARSRPLRSAMEHPALGQRGVDHGAVHPAPLFRLLP